MDQTLFMMNSNPRVAIIHDWLVTYAGAERVLEQMLNCFPDSDLFSLVNFLDPKNQGFILNKNIKTSFIQKLPFAMKKYRMYLPLMPLAIEQFDLTDYDLIISSSHAVAKGVIVGPDQLHICMCYSPIRYAWDLQHQYLKEEGLDSSFKGLLARYFLHKIRIWDTRTSNGVDKFIAISNFIGRRIKKAYNRDSTTIYPPVDTNAFFPTKGQKDEFYLTCSRMVPYKKIDLIAATFTKKFPHKKLKIIGDGPEMKKIRKISGDNVELLGYQDFEVLRDHLQRAKAFIFASIEDFGIAPLEAQSCGTPVIAFNKGAAKETIIPLGSGNPNPTGIFFDSQTISSLANAIKIFEENSDRINSNSCINNAVKFSEARFQLEFRSFVENAYREFIK